MPAAMFVVHSLLLLFFAVGASTQGLGAAVEILRFENYKTELFLDHATTETGGPIVVSPYSLANPGQRWRLIQSPSIPGYSLFHIAGVAPNDNVFVNAAVGNGLTARPIPTAFNVKSLGPYTYYFTLPLTTLAVTAPTEAGGQVTLQQFNASDAAQHWMFSRA